MLRAGRMEEFVTEEEEPWYDQRDLEQGEDSCVREERNRVMKEDLEMVMMVSDESFIPEICKGVPANAHHRDLHLAAELGKTLLERNKELEDSLQQMYINNEEQVHEIEVRSKYLSKHYYLVEQQPLDEENDRLRDIVSSLHSAMASERSRRESVERECAVVLQEFEQMEQRLLGAEGCKLRVQELEAELLEMQQLRKSRVCLIGDLEDGLQTLLSNGPETDTPEEETGQEDGGGLGQQGGGPVRKSCSDTALNTISAVSGRRQGGYPHHGNGERKRGMSILREVDEQYHALLEKYEELLGKCRHHEETVCHAGVQTSRPVSRDPSMKEYSLISAEPSTSGAGVTPPTPPQTPSTPEALEGISRQVEQVDKRLSQNTPEYKALFKEIFSRLQKTKRDMNSPKNRKTHK
ncbi:hypothetical protein XENOCAPTIV_026898 [Xenoophorus captivus]|uniref:Cerebellar degeneration-related protein 2-like n=1 Tax=Xenoophorus captivus TaxID=1517983 RepID=A0ABV0Q6D0_9TELE